MLPPSKSPFWGGSSPSGRLEDGVAPPQIQVASSFAVPLIHEDRLSLGCDVPCHRHPPLSPPLFEKRLTLEVIQLLPVLVVDSDPHLLAPLEVNQVVP